MTSQLTNGRRKSVYDSMNPTTREFVRDRAKKIHFLARRSAQDIHDQGKYLTEVKGRLDHGEFLEWIEEEFAWSHDTVTRYMNVYEQFKLRNLRNLEIDISALYLIAERRTPEPVRAELIKKAEAGEHITHAVAKTAIEEKKTVVVYTRATATVEPQQVVVHTNVLPPAQSQNVIEVAAVKVLPEPEKEEEVNQEVDEPEEETLPELTKQATSTVEGPEEKSLRLLHERVTTLADGKAHTMDKIGGGKRRSITYALLREMRVLPWLRIEKVGGDKYKFVIDQELRDICEDRVPRPELSGASVYEFVQRIRKEIHRKRKANNEKVENSHWITEQTIKLEQKRIMDSAEADLLKLSNLMALPGRDAKS